MKRSNPFSISSNKKKRQRTSGQMYANQFPFLESSSHTPSLVAEPQLEYLHPDVITGPKLGTSHASLLLSTFRTTKRLISPLGERSHIVHTNSFNSPLQHQCQWNGSLDDTHADTISKNESSLREDKYWSEFLLLLSSILSVFIGLYMVA